MEGVVAPLMSTVVTKLVDPLVDCGRLLLVDRQPIEKFGDEDALISRARDNTQLLFNSIWELEKKRVDGAIVAVLPKTTFRLPREKPVPEKRAQTKWEEYAKTKGIKKRKQRGTKVYDELSGEWKPRWGYRRGNDATKEWAIPIPDNKPDDTDMFEERKQAKKERVAKNEVQRLQNLKRAAKAKNSRVLRAPAEIAKLGVAADPSERTKQELRIAADRAKVATASIGKFQKKIHGEKKNIKTGKKRKFEPNLVGASTEKEKALEIAKGVLTKKPRLLQHKMAETAGPIQEEVNDRGKSKRKAGGERVRQKNSIHRSQFYQKMKKGPGKGEKGRGGGGGGRKRSS